MAAGFLKLAYGCRRRTLCRIHGPPPSASASAAARPCVPNLKFPLRLLPRLDPCSPVGQRFLRSLSPSSRRTRQSRDQLTSSSESDPGGCPACCGVKRTRRSRPTSGTGLPLQHPRPRTVSGKGSAQCGTRRQAKQEQRRHGAVLHGRGRKLREQSPPACLRLCAQAVRRARALMAGAACVRPPMVL